MTLLHVIWRGIRYRPGRSIVVLALAAVATAAAVMTPAYTAAAHQSLLTDALADLPDGQDGARVAAAGHRAEADESHFDDIYRSITDQVEAAEILSPLREPVRYAHTRAKITGGEWPATATIGYRQDLCEQLRIVDGECATGTREVLISQRSAEFERVEVGDELTVKATGVDLTVAGVYEPRDPAAGYWGTSNPFRFGESEDGYDLDTLFTVDPRGTAAVNRPVEAGIEYGFDIPAVRLADAAELGRTLATMDSTGEVAGVDRRAESRLQGVLEDVRTEQDLVSTSVPLVTIPLLLLSWFVLFLVVARLSEERSPQIALSKLRGHRFSSVTGFGTGEAAALIVAGVPVGIGLGWALVQLVAWLSLAEGAGVTVTADVAVYGLIALMGAWAAALAASRPVLTRPVLTLLRRVPARGGWRAGLIEGGLVALAPVAVWQVLATPDAGAIGLLVTPLLALVVGVAAARLLELVARRRLPAALRKARISRVLALAQLSRRPETRRMVVLVTVAAAVATFGVCAWDVSQHNRELAASDDLGADRVYTLSAGDPQAVMAAVEELDPDGEHLMAVLRRIDRFDNKDFTTIAAQTDRLSTVARWRDMTPERLERLAAELHPQLPKSLRVDDEIAVTADVEGYSANRKPSLVAKVVPDGGDPVTVRLGTLSEGTKTYTATEKTCAEGCRLIGVGVSRHPADFSNISAELTVTGIADSGGELDASLSDCEHWRPTGQLWSDDLLRLDCGDGLSITADSDNAEDLLAEYASSPAALPVALAGRYPAPEVDKGAFSAMGPQRELQRYQRVEAVSVVPRGGARAMMVDLEYTNLAAQNHAALSDQDEISFEVWANASAGADVAERLAEAGLVVTTVETRAERLDRMGRAAPALSLRLYLVAAGLALLLVAGAILLSATVGAAVRGYDNAALAVAGVPRRRLRAAAIREHLYWIVFPGLAGIGAGAGGLALILPSVPLVSAEAPEVAPSYLLRPELPGLALALVAAVLAAVLWLAVRIGQRRGAARRLRDSES